MDDIDIAPTGGYGVAASGGAGTRVGITMHGDD
jgi:hypothetical protein